MKKLILVRHGKSSWEHNLPDDKRPLKKRGILDANLVSRAFKAQTIKPDIVLSSPANRAYTTCEIFSENFVFSLKKVKIRKDLYDFQGDQVIKVIKETSDSNENIMIFGHNHAFTSICNIFGSVFIENLPTSGLVVIDFDVNSWQDIKKGKTILKLFPRDLK